MFSSCLCFRILGLGISEVNCLPIVLAQLFDACVLLSLRLCSLLWGPHRVRRVPETHSVIKKTTHLQETVITQMGWLGVLLCECVCVRVCVCICVHVCNGRGSMRRRQSCGGGEVMCFQDLVQRAPGTQGPPWLVR